MPAYVFNFKVVQTRSVKYLHEKVATHSEYWQFTSFLSNFVFKRHNSVAKPGSETKTFDKRNIRCGNRPQTINKINKVQNGEIEIDNGKYKNDSLTGLQEDWLKSPSNFFSLFVKIPRM